MIYAGIHDMIQLIILVKIGGKNDFIQTRRYKRIGINQGK